MYTTQKTIVLVPDWIATALTRAGKSVNDMLDIRALKEALDQEELALLYLLNDPTQPYQAKVTGGDPNQVLYNDARSAEYVYSSGSGQSAMTGLYKTTQMRVAESDILNYVVSLYPLVSRTLETRFFSGQTVQDKALFEDTTQHYKFVDIGSDALAVIVSAYSFGLSADENVTALRKHLLKDLLQKLNESISYEHLANRVIFKSYLNSLVSDISA